MEERPQHKKSDTQDDLIFDLNFVPKWVRKSEGKDHYNRVEHTRKAHPGEKYPFRDRLSSKPHPEQSKVSQTHPQSIKELPLTISFLPEQKRLISLVRQIQRAQRAYPLMGLATLLTHDPEGYLVKIEADANEDDFEFFQCSRCNTVEDEEEGVVQHLMAKHMDDFYEKKEIETEPPTGSFSSIARCKGTGILLAPPNHHSYAEKIAELHHSRFAHLSLEEYKRNIEILKDEELVEQWRERSRRKIVYQLKSAPETKPVNLYQAEIEFSKLIPKLYKSTRRVIITAKVSQKIGNRDIARTVRKAWMKECRFPSTLSFALRVAFRHIGLHLFKTNKKVVFVTYRRPRPIKPEDTVPEIAETLMFLRANPGSTRLQLLETLYPSVTDPESKEAREILKPLGWLIERGHIIEFFDSSLAVPLGRS